MKLKLKKYISSVKNFCRKRYDRIYHYLHKEYSDTQKGVTLICKWIGSVVSAAILTAGSTERIPWIFVMVPAILIVYGIISCVTWLLHISRQIIGGYKTSTIAAAAVLMMSLYRAMRYGDTTKTASGIAAAVITLSVMIFARNAAALLKRRRTPLIVIACALSCICNIIICILLFGEGFPDKHMKDYAALGRHPLYSKRVEAANEFTVNTVTYGVEENDCIKTHTVDLHRYTSYEGKITEKIRDSYWGHTLSSVPVKGEIWYPEEKENCPVLFIIHGNHTMVTPSYLGYEYLGKYLASNGYVVVSVDQSMMNGYIDGGLIGENDARAILLLENIKSVLHMSQKEKGALYNKIDRNNIAIAGHSRGGEAVAAAALLNNYSVYPDNGTIRLNYHYDIKTVIAISPTCDQYKPGGRKVELQDVNYFLIHGSNDMDVSEFLGMKQYQNVSFSGKGDYRKAYLYVIGANHGQFNTKWGRYDTGYPDALFLNTAPLISGKDQRDILKKFVKVCLDVTLTGDRANEDFLQDCTDYRENLPATVYVQGYQNSGFQAICNYEEDNVIDQGTIDNSRVDGTNIIWHEVYTQFTDITEKTRGNRDNYAVRLNWNETRKASYTINVKDTPVDLSGYQYFQFDVVDIMDSAVKENNYHPLDFTIAITKEDGSTKSYRLSEYHMIYPPIEVCLSKVDYLFGNFVYKHHFQTVRIPLDMDVQKITQIQFQFDQSDEGVIMLDNIGLSD